MYIAIDGSVRSAAVAVRDARGEIFGDRRPSPQRKATLLLCKPLDLAAGERASKSVVAFAKTLVELFPPSLDDHFARHRSFNHLRIGYAPAEAAAINRQLDRAFWPNEEVRLECQKILGDDPLLTVPRSEEFLVLFLEHYLPDELMMVADDLGATAAKIYGVSQKHFALLKVFTQSYRNLQLVKIGAPAEDEQVAAKIEGIHGKMLRLFQLVEAQSFPHPPTFVTLEADIVEGVTARLNGEAIPPVLSELRTIVSLALLQPKDWFSVEKFSLLYFGEKAGDTQKRFNTCVSRIPWLNVETAGKSCPGMRRVVGVVFSGAEGLDETLKAFLHEHYDETTKKALAAKSK